MKEILYFLQRTCPYCIKANQLLQEAFKQHPEYRNIPLRIVDELADPQFADQYDYYYVPTFYVGNEKVHEGPVTEKEILGILEKAGRD